MSSRCSEPLKHFEQGHDTVRFMVYKGDWGGGCINWKERGGSPVGAISHPDRGDEGSGHDNGGKGSP